MIALPSFRGAGLLAVLYLCGNSFAFGFEEGKPPLAPTPAENSATPVPIPDPGTDSSDPFAVTPNPATDSSNPAADPTVPGVPVDCQCRHCRPDSHRSRGFFGWFRGRSERNCIAEYNSMCSGCNVNPEPPFGTSYSATIGSQIAKGEAALMVLHHFDFVPCQGALNFRGRLRLQKIASRALHNPFPIIIEASRHDADLDAARHAAVIAELALVPVPAERVVIGPSPARALDGVDAELIHLNLLRLTGGGIGQASTGGAASGVPVAR